MYGTTRTAHDKGVHMGAGIQCGLPENTGSASESAESVYCRNGGENMPSVAASTIKLHTETKPSTQHEYVCTVDSYPTPASFNPVYAMHHFRCLQYVCSCFCLRIHF